MNSSEAYDNNEKITIKPNQTLGQASPVISSALIPSKGKDESMIPSTAKDKSSSNEYSTYDQTGKTTSAETGIEIKHATQVIVAQDKDCHSQESNHT